MKVLCLISSFSYVLQEQMFMQYLAHQHSHIHMINRFTERTASEKAELGKKKKRKKRDRWAARDKLTEGC